MVILKALVFWVVTTCSFVGRYQHFRGTQSSDLKCVGSERALFILGSHKESVPNSKGRG